MINKQINIGWLLVGVLFSGNTNNGDHAGFGYANTNNTPSNTNANVSLSYDFSKLTQHTKQRPYLLVEDNITHKGAGRETEGSEYEKQRI